MSIQVDADIDTCAGFPFLDAERDATLWLSALRQLESEILKVRTPPATRAELALVICTAQTKFHVSTINIPPEPIAISYPAAVHLHHRLKANVDPPKDCYKSWRPVLTSAVSSDGRVATYKLLTRSFLIRYVLEERCKYLSRTSTHGRDLEYFSFSDPLTCQRSLDMSAIP